MYNIAIQYAEYIKYVLGIIASLGIIVEVTPIVKINPVSMLLKYFGKMINKDLIDEIQELRKNFNSHEIDQIRWNILDFSNSCMQGRRHTKEEFDHVIKDYEKYEDIIRKEGLKNGQIDMAYEIIQDIYKECIRNDDFL